MRREEKRIQGFAYSANVVYVASVIGFLILWVSFLYMYEKELVIEFWTLRLWHGFSEFEIH